MYLALYRKWRPETFTQVFGQDHITKTLRSQTASGRFSHAYLFTGTRGTGKTTCAKLLARAINCLSPQNGEPCNQCANCLGILEGSIPDVSEIDAASYSGVDHIRALREELIYSPVQTGYRVYIIDEVHMLSTGAFNALLKTLEEPPAHVVFILATTELHKVPATIVSRCQRFAFRRISAEDVKGRLWQISQRENISITPEALSLLASMADGSLRDGINLLDQCVLPANGGAIDLPLLQEVLGLSGQDETRRWLHILADGDGGAALTHLGNAYQAGRDYASLLDELGTLMRDLLLGQMLGDLSVTRLPSEQAAALGKLWPRQRLLFALDHIMETQSRLPHSINKRMETELCVLRLCGLITSPPNPNGSAPTGKTAATPTKSHGTIAPPSPTAAQPSPTAFDDAGQQPPPTPPPFGTDRFPEDTLPPFLTDDPPGASPAAAPMPAAQAPAEPSGNTPAEILTPLSADQSPPDKLPASPPPSPAKPDAPQSPLPASDAPPPVQSPGDTVPGDTALRSTDSRWRGLLEKANPFLANFLTEMNPHCQDDTLILSPSDGFSENLLDSDFSALVTEFFPGGLRLSTDDTAVQAGSIDHLADHFQGLVTFE